MWLAECFWPVAIVFRLNWVKRDSVVCKMRFCTVTSVLLSQLWKLSCTWMRCSMSLYTVTVSEKHATKLSSSSNIDRSQWDRCSRISPGHPHRACCTVGEGEATCLRSVESDSAFCAAQNALGDDRQTTHTHTRSVHYNDDYFTSTFCGKFAMTD